MFSGAANAGVSNIGELAMTGADLAGAAGGLSAMLPMGGMAGGVLKGAGKLFRPLDIALQGAGLASAISQGNSTQIGATAGDMAGGLGGAAAGGRRLSWRGHRFRRAHYRHCHWGHRRFHRRRHGRWLFG